jgi:hypothetical protein
VIVVAEEGEEKKVTEEAALRELAQDYVQFKRRLLEFSCLPMSPEFIAHTRAAKKELLLALRSLLNTRIERLEEAEKVPPKKVRKVPVE